MLSSQSKLDNLKSIGNVMITAGAELAGSYLT